MRSQLDSGKHGWKVAVATSSQQMHVLFDQSGRCLLRAAASASTEQLSRFSADSGSGQRQWRWTPANRLDWRFGRGEVMRKGGSEEEGSWLRLGDEVMV